MKSWNLIGTCLLVSIIVATLTVLAVIPVGEFQALTKQIMELNQRIDTLNVRLRLAIPGLILRNDVHGIAVEYAIDCLLVYRIIEVESHWNPRAVSRKQAYGLMQVRVPAAQDMLGDTGLTHTDLFEVRTNVRAGVLYLKQCMIEFRSLPVAISAYHRGIAAVRATNSTITNRRYVKSVLDGYKGDWHRGGSR
jgi:soluble lytic murein transglycosylase-like protein